MENNYEVQRSLGRIEGGIAELKADVSLMRTDHAMLRGEFNKLEAGRLTRLESEFATTKALNQAKARSTAFWTAFITGLITSGLSVLISHFL